MKSSYKYHSYADTYSPSNEGLEYSFGFSFLVPNSFEVPRPDYCPTSALSKTDDAYSVTFYLTLDFEIKNNEAYLRKISYSFLYLLGEYLKKQYEYNLQCNEINDLLDLKLIPELKKQQIITSNKEYFKISQQDLDTILFTIKNDFRLIFSNDFSVNWINNERISISKMSKRQDLENIEHIWKTKNKLKLTQELNKKTPLSTINEKKSSKI